MLLSLVVDDLIELDVLESELEDVGFGYVVVKAVVVVTGSVIMSFLQRLILSLLLLQLFVVE